MENIRPPFLHQDSYFSIAEQLWLRQAYQRDEVQDALSHDKAPVKDAAGVLQWLFRQEMTKPGPGESEEDFKARVRRARKEDRPRLSRKVETQAEFDERMKTLPEHIYKWVSDWRGTLKRVKGAGVVAWQGPPIPPITKPRKPRALTGLDVFQTSAEAPPWPVIETADGKSRADVAGWRKICAEAWPALSDQEQAIYTAVADDRNRKRAAEADGDHDIDDLDQESDDESQGGGTGVAPKAEDVAAWIDILMEALYKNAGWGGFVYVGGPDDTDSKGKGVNRYGLSFHQALLQAIGWTPQEFEMVFDLWVQQSVAGPQTEEERTFAVLATRALLRYREIMKAQQSSTTTLGAGTSTTVVARPVIATDAPAVEQVPISPLVSGDASATSSSRGPIPATGDVNSVHDEAVSLTSVDEHYFLHDDLPMQDVTQQASTTRGEDVPPSPFGEHIPGSGKVNNVPDEALSLPNDAESYFDTDDLPMPDATPEALTPRIASERTEEAVDVGAAPVRLEEAITRPRGGRKKAQASGVPMPEATGLQEIARPTRSVKKTARARGDGMDGTAPLITKRAKNM
ncbi:hypothetical protein DICSQDRAFT_170189 [Dichomitus squalens LYAD-421 SS1]|uniref:HMG box domain-containing protein n=1 Tax=Dichomitus squalens (strain LYAD-421) TaxID=732165 RepID=R7T2B8_DICSQ|nr:uncharacterized protein DICSQDRAFT_170189 [Dichomitus squalens LYAD-421 SS1]EJF61437.1 hypothetical protein DICSQDRAFT_170189 [Dichomitus squalens LYAD-421 SS1]